MTRTESSILFVDNPNEIISAGGMTSMNSGKQITLEKEEQFPVVLQSSKKEHIIISVDLLMLRETSFQFRPKGKSRREKKGVYNILCKFQNGILKKIDLEE